MCGTVHKSVDVIIVNVAFPKQFLESIRCTNNGDLLKRRIAVDGERFIVGSLRMTIFRNAAEVHAESCVLKYG